MERNIIFPALRWICLISIILIILGNIILIVKPGIIIPDEKIKIHYSDVKKSLSGGKSSEVEETVILKNYDLLSQKQKKILKGWINQLSGYEQAQEFCDGLDDIISQSLNDKTLNVTWIEVIDIYKKLYFDKIKITSPVETQIKKASKLIFILSSLFAVILLTMILGILAIEKNTRKT